MCGIAGFIGTDARLTEDLLVRMRDAQVHRGPDDTGIMFRVERPGTGDEVRVGMAHNRLSILDLSAAGHQPMSDESGKDWLCYNGEFYNSPSIRAELKEKGASFRSSSDSEVLLELCRTRGVESAVREVNGMFAFAFYRNDSSELTLCRDRAGQKPLYYLVLEDGSLVYASELPALLATGLAGGEVDAVAFDQYWTLGYTVGERTFYASIRRLAPGRVATWTRSGLSTCAFWEVTFDPGEDDGRPVSAYVDDFVPLLEDAVKLRLLSDVPVGICLSGGIDSALMALMISRLRADVPAYSISFEDTEANEAHHAAAIAGHLAIEHRILDVGEDMSDDFARIASWFGEPFGDASSIPMYYLARLIRQHATVALTGDGGDELFGGYHHYRDGVRLWMRNVLDADTVRRGVRERIRDFMLSRMGHIAGYERMQRHVNDRVKRELYGPGASGVIGGAPHRREWLAATADPLAAMQNCDFHVYMTDDVLTKVDRMSMAHALECRSPFMDYRIIEWAARLPTRVKMSRDGKGKLLLREVLARFMPINLFDRPKQGFTPPWERWCSGPLRESLRADWASLDDSMVRDEAIDRLVPADGDVSHMLSWMAYSYVECRKSRGEPHK